MSSRRRRDSRLLRWRWLWRNRVPVCGEVFPAGVHGLDEYNLLGTPPTLDLFLTGDRVMDVREVLEVDEPVDAIARGEPFRCLRLVLPHASLEVAGDARVDRLPSVGQDVGVVVEFAMPSHSALI